MKHRWGITVLLLSMFLVTQFIGLFILSSYDPSGSDLPFGLENPDENAKPSFVSILFSFVVAFAIIFFMTKYRWKWVIKAWFFFVIALALGIAFNALLGKFVLSSEIIALLLSVPLAWLKVFRPGVFVHNITELLIYPGIATVFIPLLDPVTVILLLVAISFYDMWAVWHSGVMQKMAKFQMEELKIFGGFLIPSVSSKDKVKIRELRMKYKDRDVPKSVASKKFKVNLAILGGGDVIFPIITAGVFMKYFGIVPALFVVFGSFFALTYLFLKTEKGKSYPAMPYITVGILGAITLWRFFVY